MFFFFFFYANGFFSYAHSWVGVLLGYGFLFFYAYSAFFYANGFFCYACSSFFYAPGFFFYANGFFFYAKGSFFYAALWEEVTLGGPSAECNCQEGLVQNVIVGRL